MINPLLIINITLLLTVLHLYVSSKISTIRDNILLSIVLGFMLHLIIVLPVISDFKNLDHPNYLLSISFGFLYGPLLFFYSKTYIFNFIGLKPVITHLIPFILSISITSLVVLTDTINEPAFQYLLASVYLLSSLSLSLYSIFVIIYQFKRKTAYEIVMLAWYFLLFSAYKISVLNSIHVDIHFIETTNTSLLIGIRLTYFLSIGTILIFLTSYMSHIEQHTALFSGIRANPMIRQTSKMRQNLQEENLLKKQNSKPVNIKSFFDSNIIYNPEMDTKLAAKHLDISIGRLQDETRKTFGGTFNQTLTTKRIEHACSLLNKKRLKTPINQLYAKSGFKSQASFYRNFRAVTNSTPTQYRKEVLKSKNPKV